MSLKDLNSIKKIKSTSFLSEYAYLLSEKGRIYCITDVEELHLWHLEHLNSHLLFKKVEETEIENDICVKLIQNETEEGKKVSRNNGKKYYCVYEKI